MKLRLLIIPALMATALLAQDPGGFGGRRGFGGPQGGPVVAPPLPGPDGNGPRGPIMATRRGEWRRGQWGDRGMRGPGMHGMGMRGMGMEAREAGLGRLLSDPAVRQQVGVTAEQAAKIRQEESDFQKAEIRNRADLQIKRMDLNDLLSAEKPDRAAVDAKVQEIGAAQTAMEKAAIDNRLTMRDALTPAQRQKLQQVMMQRRQARAGGPAAGGVPQGPGRGGRGNAPAPRAPNPQGQAAPKQ